MQGLAENHQHFVTKTRPAATTAGRARTPLGRRHQCNAIAVEAPARQQLHDRVDRLLAVSLQALLSCSCSMLPSKFGKNKVVKDREEIWRAAHRGIADGKGLQAGTTSKVELLAVSALK